jgi:hypothetical protein
MLPQEISKSVLEALAVFQGLNAVHTGLLSSPAHVEATLTRYRYQPEQYPPL